MRKIRVFYKNTRKIRVFRKSKSTSTVLRVPPGPRLSLEAEEADLEAGWEAELEAELEAEWRAEKDGHERKPEKREW